MYYNAGILFPQVSDYIRIVATPTEKGLNYCLVPTKAFKILDNDLNAFMIQQTSLLERNYDIVEGDSDVLQEISYALTVACNAFVKEKLEQGKAFLMDFKSNDAIHKVFGENNVVYRGKNQEWTLFNPLVVLKVFESIVKH